MNKNKPTTLIIGSSGSFGISIAKKLAKANHNLILTCMNQKESPELKKIAQQLKNKFKIQVSTHRIDVKKNSQIENLIKENSHLINNLVYSVSAPVQNKLIIEGDWRDYENHWQLQVKGLWYLIKLLIEKKNPLKRIIAIGTIYLFDTPPTRISGYITAKYALSGFIKTAAVELAPYNITVNIISPGVSGKGISGSLPAIFLDLVKKQTPLKRLVSPDDVALLVEFLLSQKAEYLTGLNIPIAGGFHM